jgi:hypothetical protein
MSNYRDPHDPMYGYEPADRTGSWGLIAGVLCLVVILGLGLGLGLALGAGHERTRVASNNATPPQMTAPACLPWCPA